MAFSLALPFSMSLGLLGLPMAQYGNFRSFLGGSGTPKYHFWGQKGSKLTPPDVKYNVQPCSTNVQPIWGCWECLWPNMAILGQKGHKIWPVAAPQGSKRVPQRSIILIWPTDI